MASFTYLYDTTNVVAVRAGEVPNASFLNGVNYGGANACGIGINMGGGAIVGTPEQFTLEDQAEVARTPQKTQYIGGTALNDGDTSVADVEVGIPATSNGDGSVTNQDSASLLTLGVGWDNV